MKNKTYWIAETAVMIALLTGGINLSIGSVMALTTVLWGRMLVGNAPDAVHYIVPVLLVVGTGMFIGLVNGLLITKLGMPPFIATFANSPSRTCVKIVIRMRVAP